MSAVPVRGPARAPRRAPGRAGDAAASRRPRLRVVGPPRHVARYVLVAVLAFAGGIFGTVSLNALAAEEAFAVRALEGDVRELSLRYEELTAEVARLEAPGRIRDVAVHQLGMVQAPEPGYLLAERPVAGDGEAAGGDGMVRTSWPIDAGALADPVKPVLGAGR